MDTRPTRTRSIIKAMTYRVVIVCLDFGVVYLLTRKAKVAVGFMIISNLYTTAAYFLHERIWARVTWGKQEARSVQGAPEGAQAERAHDDSEREDRPQLR